QPAAMTLSSSTESIDFGDLPDGQLIPSIEQIHPELAFDQDKEWGLERVVDRVRIKSLSVWLPIKTIVVESSITRFVDVPEVPSWVSRSWAASYRHALAATGDERSSSVSLAGPLDAHT